MKAEDWRKVKVIEDISENNNLKIGDYFLYGSSMVNQKEAKQVGEEISYYMVLNKKNKNIEYTIKFDVLREG